MQQSLTDLIARIMTREIERRRLKRELRRMQSDSPVDGSCSTCKLNRRGVCTLENSPNSG